MSKKHRDISTYFSSNKKHKASIDINASQPSTTDTFDSTDNNELESNNNDVSTGTYLSSDNENANTTVNLSVNDDDIGLYVSKRLGANDFLLLNRLLVKPWVPPSNYVFPKIEQNGRNRSVCQHSWLVKYSWLSYSKLNQGVYCRYCVLFSRQGDYQSLGQFINKPLRSLKDAMEYLSAHEKCNYHKFSVTQATECVQRFSHPNSDVDILLHDIDIQQQNQNRLILTSIIKCILFLGQQNIAFRGNDDDGLPDYDNTSQGNFKSLILFRAEAGDQVLQKHLNHHSKNATYMGSKIQNELINLCANSIRKYLLNEVISQNKFYAVIADETADISGTEQLSLSIRYVSEENDISIKEIFLGFVALSDLSAIGITETIITSLKKYGLNIENIRGQGYDGASVVAGKLGGVQKLIRDISPRAVYIHCSNHSLDLVIAEACALRLIKTFFGTIKSIVKFINGSPKRKRLLVNAIESTTNETKRRHLVKLCDTRWVEKHTSIIVFKQVYFGIVIALDYLTEHGDSETSGFARSYGKALTDIDFAIPLIIVNRVFCITKPYAEQLQKPTCDLLKCYQSIEQASLYLAELIYDDNQLEELYNEFTSFVQCNEIEENLSRTAGHRYRTTKDYFTHVYKTFLDTTIKELGRRFTIHQKFAMTISHLIPSYIVSTNFSNVSDLFNHYKDDLQTDDENVYKAEFDTWKFKILQMREDERPTTIGETLKMIQPVKVFYPNIYILLQLYALIPVSVAGAERSFSVLKLIKTYLRNRIGDERLSSLALINIHRNIVQNLNIEDIIDEFSKSKHDQGNTALHIATRQSYPDIIRLLLRYHASRTVLNNEGKTPEQMTSDDAISKLYQVPYRPPANATENHFVADKLEVEPIEWVDSYRHAYRISYENHQYMKRWITKVPLKKLLEEIVRGYIDKLDFPLEKTRTDIKTQFQYAIELNDPLPLAIVYTGTSKLCTRLNTDLANIGSDFRFVSKRLDYPDNEPPKDLGQYIYASLLINHSVFRPYQHASTTFRGMTITVQDLEAYKMGKIVITRSFLSTSKNRETAEFYLGFEDIINRPPVICIYKVSNPQSSLCVQSFSEFPIEEEVLIVPFIAFEITAVKSVIIKREGIEYQMKEIELVECVPNLR